MVRLTISQTENPELADSGNSEAATASLHANTDASAAAANTTSRRQPSRNVRSSSAPAAAIGSSTQTEGFTSEIAPASAPAAATRHHARPAASTYVATVSAAITASLLAVRSYASVIGVSDTAAQSAKASVAPERRATWLNTASQPQRKIARNGSRHVQVESPNARCAR